jgi:outer membrane lipoprotein-sorting protein
VRRLRLGVLIAALLTASGCGEAEQTKVPVSLDQVPAAAVDAAKKKAPDVNFTTAFKVKFEGQDAFEIRGKNKQGKIREVEVSPAGQVLEVE